jgi:two-component system response regulator HydG
MIERAVVLSSGAKIDVTDLARADDFSTHAQASPLDKRDSAAIPIESLPTLAEHNLEYISYVLNAVNGVKEQAARILDLDRKTLYRRIREIEDSSMPLEKVRKIRTGQMEDVH